MLLLRWLVPCWLLRVPSRSAAAAAAPLHACCRRGLLPVLLRLTRQPTQPAGLLLLLGLLLRLLLPAVLVTLRLLLLRRLVGRLRPLLLLLLS